MQAKFKFDCELQLIAKDVAKSHRQRSGMYIKNTKSNGVVNSDGLT